MPSQPQDPLRNPLNEILGSEGNVRVLRVLAFSEKAIGRTTVARRAELNASGVRRTLDRLGDIGFVEALGSGRNRSVRIRDRHPLAGAIRSLFHEERHTYERLLDSAKRAFNREGFPARAVWVESTAAPSPGTVHIGVLASPHTVERAVAAVQDQLQGIEEELATRFVVHAYTDADALALTDEETQRLGDLTLLYGWLPQEWLERSGGPVVSHRYLDERARVLATAIAHLLPNDPSIIDRALHWIDQRLEAGGGRNARDLQEWKRILSQLSLQQVQAFLREDSERANRLRQSLPLVDVLSASERKRLMSKASR